MEKPSEYRVPIAGVETARRKFVDESTMLSIEKLGFEIGEVFDGLSQRTGF